MERDLERVLAEYEQLLARLTIRIPTAQVRAVLAVNGELIQPYRTIGVGTLIAFSDRPLGR